MLDLILRGGRVSTPFTHIDGVMDVGFAAGRVSGIAHASTIRPMKSGTSRGRSSPPVSSTCIRTYIGGGTSVSVDATDLARRSGTTTSSMPAAQGQAILLASGSTLSSHRR